MDNENLIPNDSQQSAATGLQSLTRMLRILFFCFLTLIIAVFVYYFLFSGIFRVDEQYKAMLLRFGVLQYRVDDTGRSPILQSGRWYWSYPYPVDEVILVPANKSVSVSTGNTFKAWVNPTGAEMGASARELRTGVDGYVVAGDMHIFHTEWVVSYRVDDASQYYLEFYDDNDTDKHESIVAKHNHSHQPERKRGHEQIIRNMLSEAVITETANWTTEELIKASRVVTDENGEVSEQRIENRVRSKLEALVDRIGIGIELQTVTLVGIYQPPAAALQAFNQVNASERNKQTAIQMAETFANTLLSQASASQERLIGEANAYKETIVHRLQAEAQYFQAIQKEYAKNPESTLTVLYTEALQQLLASVSNKYVLHTMPENGSQQLRLQISAPPATDDNSAMDMMPAGPVGPQSVQPGMAQ